MGFAVRPTAFDRREQSPCWPRAGSSTRLLCGVAPPFIPAPILFWNHNFFAVSLSPGAGTTEWRNFFLPLSHPSRLMEWALLISLIRRECLNQGPIEVTPPI